MVLYNKNQIKYIYSKIENINIQIAKTKKQKTKKGNLYIYYKKLAAGPHSDYDLLFSSGLIFSIRNFSPISASW